LRNSNAAIQIEMFLRASWAIAFARLVVTLAREFVATADAIAIAGD
jgi:hypothetical protein